jgi:3-hydroxyisobutyrate dehydrogenase-like beta-hydroxyacid dehydrogenase
VNYIAIYSMNDAHGRPSGELDALVSSIPSAHLVASPVFGAPAMADKAQLLIVMSGNYHSKKEVAYLFVPAIGRKIVDLGENIEKGDKYSVHLYVSMPTEDHYLAPTFKLIGNSMILGTLEILAEAYTLSEKAGIPAENIHGLVQGKYFSTFDISTLTLQVCSEILPAPGYAFLLLVLGISIMFIH